MWRRSAGAVALGLLAVALGTAVSRCGHSAPEQMSAADRALSTEAGHRTSSAESAGGGGVVRK